MPEEHFIQYRPHASSNPADVEVGQAAETPAYRQMTLEWQPAQIARLHDKNDLQNAPCEVPAIIPKEWHNDFKRHVTTFRLSEPRAPSSNDKQGHVEPEMPSQGGSAETQHTFHSHRSHDNSSSLYPPRLRFPSPSPTPPLEDLPSDWQSPSTAAVPTPESALFELLLPEQNSDGLHYSQPYGLQTSPQCPSNPGIPENFSTVVSQPSAPSWNAPLDPTFEIQNSSLQPAGVGRVEDFFSPNAGHGVYNQTQPIQDDFLFEEEGVTYFVGEQNVGELESENEAPSFGDTFLSHTGHAVYDQTQLNQNNVPVGDGGSYNAVGVHELDGENGASFSGFNLGDVFFPHADHQVSNQTQLNQDDFLFVDGGFTYVAGEQHVGGLDNEGAA